MAKFLVISEYQNPSSRPSMIARAGGGYGLAWPTVYVLFLTVAKSIELAESNGDFAAWSELAVNRVFV